MRKPSNIIPSSSNAVAIATSHRQTYFIYILSFLLVLSITSSHRKQLQSKSSTSFHIPTTAAMLSRSSTSKIHNRPYWNLDVDAPSFCRTLVSNPLVSPGVRGCRRDIVSGKCNMVSDANESVRFVSQFQQDYFLYVHHFSKLRGRRRGTYIDLAANEAIGISNTYIFDTCLGWDGLCVEANPQYHDQLRVYRSCAVVPTCISDDESERVEFFMAGPVGGVVSTNKRAKQWKTHPGQNKKVSSTFMKCRSMKSLMNEKRILHVDYLSLDVEGHELKVLKSFDWERIQIDIITVEVNANFSVLQRFLEERRFKKHHVTGKQMEELTTDQKHINSDGNLFTDAIFVHDSVTFGNPV